MESLPKDARSAPHPFTLPVALSRRNGASRLHWGTSVPPDTQQRPRAVPRLEPGSADSGPGVGEPERTTGTERTTSRCWCRPRRRRLRRADWWRRQPSGRERRSARPGANSEPSSCSGNVFDHGKFLDDGPRTRIEDEDVAGFAREAIGRDQVPVEKEQTTVRHRVLRFPDDTTHAQVERDDPIAAFRKLARIAVEAYGDPNRGARIERARSPR